MTPLRERLRGLANVVVEQLGEGAMSLDKENLQSLNNIANALSAEEMIAIERSDVSFRVNSGFAIVLNQQTPVSKPREISLKDVLVDADHYLTDPLPYGCHVIFGSAGDGKTVFSHEISRVLQIPIHTVFERSLTNEPISLSYDEINATFQQAFTEPAAIIDSLRFIDLYGVGFPALEKGVNKGVFAYVQWLNVLATRFKTHLFVVVSTERPDEMTKNVYQFYLNSAANSCWLLQGFGNGLAIRADKPRSAWIPFSFKNTAVWSATDNEHIACTKTVAKDLNIKFEQKD